ncbi:MAG TPA: site-2 protease family protein [Solirubrobacteraceae bacterium]|nr:site-2 protease family protein [Solirubrobacteraceae bacterium]
MLGSGGSFQLARLFGIRIGVNASWFVILFLFIYFFQDSFRSTLDASDTVAFATALVAAVLFFGSIVLHELGHALAARRAGIEVSGIDLFLFGGVMKMNRDTDSPRDEFRVAVAGPLVTLGLVLAGAGLGLALAGPQGFWDAGRLRGDAGADVPSLLVSVLVGFNVLLLAFNLIPAFPLDGGRIARAALWKLTGDRAKATRVSAWLGQGFAVLLIAYGLYLVLLGRTFDGLWLGVLGWLLGSAARSAVLQTAFTERLGGVTVADVMDAEPVTIPAQLPAARAFEDYFLRYYGWEWFAVVDEDGRLVGLAHRDPIEQAAHGPDGGRPVRQILAPAAAEGQVRSDTPLEALLGSEALRRLGALMAVDAEGRLRGVVTFEQVSRALQARLAVS